MKEEQKEKGYLLDLMTETDETLAAQVNKMREAIKEIDLEIGITAAWLNELQFAKANYLKKIAVINALLENISKAKPEILD